MQQPATPWRPTAASFDAAVANWHASLTDRATDSIGAAEFGRLIAALPEPLRLAWRVQFGAEPRPAGLSEDTINADYIRARVRLALEWHR